MRARTINFVPCLRLFVCRNVCASQFFRLSFAWLLLVYIKMKMRVFLSPFYSRTEEGRI